MEKVLYCLPTLKDCGKIKDYHSILNTLLLFDISC